MSHMYNTCNLNLHVLLFVRLSFLRLSNTIAIEGNTPAGTMKRPEASEQREWLKMREHNHRVDTLQENKSPS